MMRPSLRLARGLVCGLLVLLSAATCAAGPLKKASFMPLWLPQAQFAGYYMALEKGFYAKHGIELTLVPGGPGISPAESLRQGKVDFAAMWLTTALQHRDRGLPLVHLSQMVQQSSLLLVARKASGIRSVADLHGRKVGLWGGDLDIPARSVFDRHQVRVRPVAQTATVTMFLRGGVTATSAMLYNEYHTILSAGLDPEELTVLPLKDHGANFPEDGLYALSTTVQRDPELVDAFVRASWEGWDYAFAHAEETVDVVLRTMKQARLPANRMHQRWMLARMQELMRPADGGTQPGELARSDLQAVTQELNRIGLLRGPVTYESFVRTRRALR